jgi:hypothetical protein
MSLKMCIILATRTNKRAKTSNSEVDRLVGAFTSSNRLVTTIEKLAKGNMNLSNDMYNMMKTLSSFNSTHIFLPFLFSC